MLEKKHQVEFAKPYTFEGKEYTKLDLSGLESLSAEDFFEASANMATSSYINPRPEADPKFCCTLAARVARLPHEFFSGLPMKEAVKVRDTVQDFFRSED